MNEDVVGSILAVCANNPAATALLASLLVAVATLSLVVVRLWRAMNRMWSTFLALQDRVLVTFTKATESNVAVSERMQSMVRELDRLKS